jgi:hypothetical protein
MRACSRVKGQHAHAHAVVGVLLSQRFQVVHRSRGVVRLHRIDNLQMQALALFLHLVRQGHGLLMGV